MEDLFVWESSFIGWVREILMRNTPWFSIREIYIGKKGISGLIKKLGMLMFHETMKTTFQNETKMLIDLQKIVTSGWANGVPDAVRKKT